MISIVIPALNEERTIKQCIEAVRIEGSDCEIIVADGGSADRTVAAASAYSGVEIVQVAAGRGRQMNAGASKARGGILLFLHADTTLEHGWSKAIRSVLDDPYVIGGAFSFCIDNPALKYRLVEAWVRLRCRLFRLPYGDQAIFIRKHAFEELNGYKEIPLMEDVDIIIRMKKLGRISMLRKKAVTSGRRWVSKGLLRTTVINQITMLLYQCGVSPETLARFYYR